jgi:YHS domain-containing protein
MKNRLRTITFLLLLGLSAIAFAQDKKAPKPETVRDPVCGLMVEKNPQLSADYKGRTYYFCSKTDRDKFKKSPRKYAK